MDEIDRAQEREQADRDRAIAATLQRIAAAFQPRDLSVLGTCIDCSQPIDPARMEALRGCCARCVRCAAAFELAMRAGCHP